MPTPTPVWFAQARLGLFLHWGIYAGAARGEWIKSREQRSDESYQPYFDNFDPDRYDPERWADDAWRAGMRYVVVTTKHHDGFCLWDSSLTDYTATRTPYGRDLLRPLVDAFRARGLRIGLYYSLLDWHHAQYPIDQHHPQRTDATARAQPRDIARYQDYLHGQVRELLTGYGPIDLMWFDFSFPGQGENSKGAAQWRSEELLAMIRELQPGIMVNNRLDLDSGDLITPEQVQPSAAEVARYPAGVAWEACQTLNNSWGYNRNDLDWKSPDSLVRMLIETVATGGNLLLNIGPTARGEWEPQARQRLDAIGTWMRWHEPSIRGAGASPYTPPPDARYTQAGNRLYLHLFTWPTQLVHLPGLAGKVAYARMLHDHCEIQAATVENTELIQHQPSGQPEGTLSLRLPVRRPEVAVPVIELILA